MLAKNTKEFAGKKVLIIVENLPVPFDRRVWQEAIALRDKGAAVSIICPTGKGYEKKHEVIEDIFIYRHTLPLEADGAIGYFFEYGSALLQEFRLALKCYFTRGFDVIHACNPPDLIYLVALPFKLTGKKFLFDHHDTNPELYLAKYGKKDFFYRLMLFLEKKTFKHANICIATNESYKKIAVERGRKNPSDVYVVRSGPCLERLKKVSPSSKWKNGRKYLVGYVGVMGKQEGLTYLVDAARYLIRQLGRNDIQFICIGDGTELDNIKNYTLQREVVDYFTFTGRVSDELLLEALSSSDICVNPDEYNEMNDISTMNKVMEYMALGKPIIQFDLTEGRNSALGASLYANRNDPVDFAMKIIELLEDPEKMLEMGAFGYHRIKKCLEWKYEKENLFNAYRKIFALDGDKLEKRQYQN